MITCTTASSAALDTLCSALSIPVMGIVEPAVPRARLHPLPALARTIGDVMGREVVLVPSGEEIAFQLRARFSGPDASDVADPGGSCGWT